MVRQDAPRARMEQEDEFKKALDVQRLERELRLQQYVLHPVYFACSKMNQRSFSSSCREKEDAEIARQLAEELEREEELQRRVRTIRDEQLAKRLQVCFTSILIFNFSSNYFIYVLRVLPSSTIRKSSSLIPKENFQHLLFRQNRFAEPWGRSMVLISLAFIETKVPIIILFTEMWISIISPWQKKKQGNGKNSVTR